MKLLSEIIELVRNFNIIQNVIRIYLVNFSLNVVLSMKNNLLFIKASDGCQIGNGVKGSGLVGSLVSSEIEIPPYATLENTIYPVVSLSNYCFKEISGIKDVTLPSTLKTIGIDSFWKTSITKLIIPSSVKTISSCSFSTMLKLKIIIFEGEIEKFGNYIFQACVLLEKVYYCGMNDVSGIKDPFYDDPGYEENDPTVYVPSLYPSSWTFGLHSVVHMNVCPTKKCATACNMNKRFQFSFSFVAFLQLLS